MDSELVRLQSLLYLRPIERRGNWRAGIRSWNVRGGDSLGARNLQVIEIDPGFLAARYGARRGEQLRILPNDQDGQDLGERAHLLIGVNRIERDVDVHSVAAGGLGIAREPDGIERLLH